MGSTVNGSIERNVSRKSLGSLDLEDIDRPMKVVEECMHRLELKHQLEEQYKAEHGSNASTSSTSSPSKESEYEDSSKEYDLNDVSSPSNDKVGYRDGGNCNVD